MIPKLVFCPFETTLPCLVCYLIQVLLSGVSSAASIPSSETQGQLVGGREKSKQARKKFGRRKVKKENKSPWGQGFNGPVPNGRSNPGF